MSTVTPMGDSRDHYILKDRDFCNHKESESRQESEVV